MSDWQYVSGELRTSGAATRVYRSADDLIGRVTRTGRAGNNPKTAFFIWSLPDTAPEYPSEDAARQALAYWARNG